MIAKGNSRTKGRFEFQTAFYFPLEREWVYNRVAQYIFCDTPVYNPSPHFYFLKKEFLFPIII